MEILYREIHINDLNDNMLKYFNRYQDVLKDWCYENGVYILKSSTHNENWDEASKKRKIIKFYTILQHNGKLFGAFDNDKLIGFSAIDKYGWPQDLPCDNDTPYWQPRYVEAQVWSDIL